MEIELLPIPKPVPKEDLEQVPSEDFYLDLKPTEINAICLQDKKKTDFFNKEFWERYFNKHKLSILEQGSNPASWSTIFRKTRDSFQVINFLFAKVFPGTVILEYEMKGDENPEHFSKGLQSDSLKKVFLRLHLSQREKKPLSFTNLNFFNMCHVESKIVFSLSFSKKGNYLACFREFIDGNAKNKILVQQLPLDKAKQLALSVFYFYLDPRK
jgi:hypothetical protein